MNIKIDVTEHLKSCLNCQYFRKDWNQICICTQNEKCIVKAEQFILFSCGIPFADIGTISAERFHNDFLILLQSHKNGCCVVSILEKKVLGSWRKGVNIVIDDYVNIGHDQIIVTFKTDEVEDFFVNDFRCCLYDTRPTDKPAKQVKDDRNDLGSGYILAVKAMENKRVSTIAAIQKEKAKIIEKIDLAQSSCLSLFKNSLDIPNKPAINRNFVDMLGSSNAVVMEEKVEVRRNVFIVKDVWKRIYNKNLLVCVQIENVTNENFWDISLSLVKKTNCSSKSKIYFSSRKTYDGVESKHKYVKVDTIIKQFCPREVLDLVTSTELCDFSTDEYNFKIDFRNNNNKFFSAILGKISLTAEEIVSGRLDVPQDFLSRDEKSKVTLDMVRRVSTFALQAKITSLKSLPGLLAKALSCHSSTIGNVVVLQPKYISGEIRLQTSYSFIMCTVYTDSEADFKILLNQIENVLPADVEFKETYGENEILCKEMLTCLLDEIRIKETFYKYKLHRENDDVIIIDGPKRKREEEEYSVVNKSGVLQTVLNTNSCVISTMSENINL